MTTYNLGNLRYNSSGYWSAGTYTRDDVVTYKNKHYICVVDSTTATPGSSSNWMSIGGGTYYRGEWNSGTAYSVGDIVTYTRSLTYNEIYTYKERATYIATQTNTNSNPYTQTSSWTTVANGMSKPKDLFLCNINEGYIPELKGTWDVYAKATGGTLVGMGDSFGTFKTRGTHHSRGGAYVFINRNYGLTTLGRNNYGASISMANDSGITNPQQSQFTHLSWYDGTRTTPNNAPPKIIQVEGQPGANHLVLFDDGTVHYSGYNGNGNRGWGETGDNYRHFNQVGYGNVNRSGTTTVLRDKQVIRIASCAGGDNNVSTANYALVRDGNDNRTIYAWGYNAYGQLGQGDTAARSAPTTMPFDQTTHGKVIEIWATGGDLGCFFLLTEQGKMFSVGYNGNGQLGIGTQSSVSSLTQVKVWGTGSGSVKKFNTCGGSSAASMLVLTRSGQLWTWGYNGAGQLGHNHTYNCDLPVRVYTGGYSGASNPVTSSANWGTPSGTALVDVVDAWMMGGNGNHYMYVTRGSSRTSNTCYACGYNGYYNLSTNANNTTNNYILDTVRYNNNSVMTNVKDITSNQGHSSSYLSHAILRNDDEWYVGGYNNGWMSIGHFDSYNARQPQDPTYTASNYRNKNNVLYPHYSDNWFPTVMGESSTKHAMWVDLNNGEWYISNNDNGYYCNHPWNGVGAPIMHKPRSLGH